MPSLPGSISTHASIADPGVKPPIGESRESRRISPPSDSRHSPFLVLTRDAAIPVLSGLVCAPLTRTVRAIPTELALGPDDGMPVSCAASFDNLRTIPKAALTTRITRLHPERLNDVCRALRIAVEC